MQYANSCHGVPIICRPHSSLQKLTWCIWCPGMYAALPYAFAQVLIEVSMHQCMPSWDPCDKMHLLLRTRRVAPKISRDAISTRPKSKRCWWLHCCRFHTSWSRA